MGAKFTYAANGYVENVVINAIAAAKPAANVIWIG